MKRLALISVLVLPSAWPAALHAEDNRLLAKINTIKVEITEAENIQKKFGAALKHCRELDGKRFVTSEYASTRHRPPV